MKESLDNRLIELYAGLGVYTRFYVKVRRRLLNFSLYDKLLPSDGLLVDLGCGRGPLANYLSLRFPRSQVVGIDMDPKRIEIASRTVGERTNISFLTEDVRKWPLPACTGIVMTDFLHHVSRQDQELILHKAFSSLEEGGVLVISEVDASAKPFYRYWASYLSDIILYFSKSHFRNAHDWHNTLSRLGFDVETVKTWNPLFAGLLLVCRK
jgi:trans-aconitate methyltransferase